MSGFLLQIILIYYGFDNDDKIYCFFFTNYGLRSNIIS